MNRFTFLFTSLFFYVLRIISQDYDVLVTESFDNTSNLSTDGSFINDNQGNGFADAFDVSANYGDPTNVTNNTYFEDGSVLHGADLDGTGGTQPTYLEVFNYTADHNDEIGFVGNFAAVYSTLESGDVLTVQYSTNGGTSYTTGLTLTGNGSTSMSCSDGTIDISQNFRTKEFTIGSNLSGQTIKIKVLISGFTSAGEAFALDEFRLVKTKLVLASEDFDNTTNLTTSSGVSTFGTPTTSATCANNEIYNVTSNSNILNCVNNEDGSIFVLHHRLSTSAADGEELVMLEHTATNNNEISFRGNFAVFGGSPDSDNSVSVQYTTNNGTNWNTAFTLTGDFTTYTTDDGTEELPTSNSFITKGFSLGTGHNGQTIKIKVVFNKLDNNDDGIALDKFVLEGSVNTVAVLPVELVKWDAFLENDLVNFNWITLSEINNDYFTIERSYDGETFTPIAILDGNGTTTDMNEYFHSTEAENGVVYYRLKQTDFNGEYKYFPMKIIKTDQDKLSNFAVLNNSGIPQLSFYSGSTTTYNLIVSDVTGKIILMNSLEVKTGYNSFEVNNYSQGIYFISLRNKNFTYTEKVFIY